MENISFYHLNVYLMYQIRWEVLVNNKLISVDEVSFTHVGELLKGLDDICNPEKFVLLGFIIIHVGV